MHTAEGGGGRNLPEAKRLVGGAGDDRVAIGSQAARTLAREHTHTQVIHARTHTHRGYARTHRGYTSTHKHT